MATPESRITRRVAARLAADIDHTLPAEVAGQLAARGTHEPASGHRYGSNQAIVTTLAAYVIDVTHVAWALAAGQGLLAELASPATSTEARAKLDLALREVLRAPVPFPGYVREEIVAAVLDELFIEVAHDEPLR
ncbi:MAG: hypothetical protein U0359_37835 [Byssovorax sp.]